MYSVTNAPSSIVAQIGSLERRVVLTMQIEKSMQHVRYQIGLHQRTHLIPSKTVYMY